ncbi:hypothetical protein V9L05_18940 [Bernardetia sp. Wsw4-3y2]|uniref:hypothetical protein n=1 Tax=Bernardetia sp. Wsw4-3y2 TaxID=3127471 RepID=UPI0030CE6421
MILSNEISFVNKTVVVSYDFLRKFYTESAVKSSTSRLWQKAEKGWIVWQSVLEANEKAKREQDRKKLPSLKELQSVALSEQLENIVLEQFYSSSEAQDLVVHYGYELAKDYSEASAWLRMLTELGKDKQAIRRLTGYNTKTNLRKAAANILKFKNLKGLAITNAASLRVKEHHYNNLGVECIISGKFGNKNAAKTEVKDFHDITLVGLYMNIDKPQIYHIDSKYGVYAQYLDKCDAHGKEAMSVSWVKQHFSCERVQAIISKQRYGKKHQKAHFMNKIRSEKVKYSNSRIALDGIPIGATFMYKGELKWQYNLFPIFDVASGAVIGFSHGFNENTAMFKEAMRQAIHTANYKKFKEVVSDGFLKKNIQANDILAFACEKYNPVVQNPQENEAENMGFILQERFRKYPWWTGLGITTNKKESRPNRDFFKVKEAPAYSVFLKTIFKEVALYNAEIQENGNSRIGNYNQNFRKQSEFIHPSVLRRMFGDWTTRKIVAGMLEVQVGKKTYKYAVPEYADWLGNDQEFSKNQARVRVYFDKNDMSQVDICNIVDKDDLSKDKFKSTLNELELTSKTFSEHTEKTKSALGTQLKNRKSTKDFLDKEEEEYKKAQKELTMQEMVNSELKVPFTNDRNGKYKEQYNLAEAKYFEDYFSFGESGMMQKAAGDGIDYSEELEQEQKTESKTIKIPKRW